jgi:ubiquitin-like 1-activating enzyme E1 A
LYDRQIRLWGVQAQEKIRSANILLITMKSLANEIAKNLVLSGIHSLTVVDHEFVTENDLGAQFFLSQSDIGTNRAQAAAPQIRKLNPRVNVIVDPTDIRAKGPDYFGVFDVVIATDLDPDSLNIINTATRLNHRPFYATGVHGFYGFIFTDLIQHDYVVEREKGNRKTVVGVETRTRSVVDVKEKNESGKHIEMVTKRELYSTWFLASDAAILPPEYLKSRRRLKAVTPILSCLRAFWEFNQLQGNRIPSTKEDLKLFTMLATQKHKALGLPEETLRSEVLRKFLQNLGSEIAPVTAILGGQLAQDVINVLGARQQPIQNMVVFDGDTMDAPMYPLHPEGGLGEALLPLSINVDPGLLLNGALAQPTILV